MVNTRAKGRRNENKAVQELETCGYEVYQVKGSTKWNKQCDIFDCWDILAITRQNVTEMLFVQVKTNKKPSKEYIKKLLNFANKYCIIDEKTEIRCELWIYFDRKGCKKFWIRGDKLLEMED